MDSLYKDEKQISGAVLEELKKLNDYMKSIRMDINAIKSVMDERGLKVHVSGISDSTVAGIKSAIEKLASGKS